MTETCSTLTPSRQKCLNRLKRIEGQVRGVGGMIEEGRYCIDLLTQLSAIKSAIAAVEAEVLKEHSQTCVATALESGSADARKEKMDELIGLLSRHYKL